MPPSPLGLIGAACVLAPALASGQTTRDPRSEMDRFASALDVAVRRVSRPSPAMLAGREAVRGYRVPGFGALFVLPPRLLPSPRSVAQRAAARAVDEAIRHLEQGLRTASSPELRQQMERNLHALRQTRAEMRQATERPADTFLLATPGADFMISGQPEIAVSGHHIITQAGEEQAMQRLEELQRELETQMAEQMRVLQEAERAHGEPERELARRMEAQVRQLQSRMEGVRREVERARMEAEREVEMRLPLPPTPPELPAAPVAPSTDAAPVPVPGLPALAPAPWHYWFSAEEPGDGRTGEALIRDVRAAVTALVEKQGTTLRQLRPDEYVAVAVDFVPRVSLVGSRVQKTLVIKVKKQDLDEHRAGRLGAAELRQRIETTEY